MTEMNYMGPQMSETAECLIFLAWAFFVISLISLINEQILNKS